MLILNFLKCEMHTIPFAIKFIHKNCYVTSIHSQKIQYKNMSAFRFHGGNLINFRAQLIILSAQI